MTTTLQHDLRISGALKAANIAQGVAVITPTANTPTSLSVSGYSLQGAGATRAWVTAESISPGSGVVEVSVSSVTATDMTVWIFRTTPVITKVHWITIRDRT